MKFKSQNTESVHLALMPKVDDSIDWRNSEPRWQKLMALRDEVLRVLEGLRREKKIASNQESSVTIYCDDEDTKAVGEFELKSFAALCIVSEVKLEKAAGETKVVAQKSSNNKCHRCWNYWPSVGGNSEHPDLCERCISVATKRH
jgi:isoleucyl-tRNA synthetase